MTARTVKCHQCGTGTEFDRKLHRNDYCPKCGSPLKCCLNCGLYSETAHNKCREPTAEWVSDKKSANFCEHFESGGTRAAGDDHAARDARDAFNSLFGKKS